jgi:hypothetical protein
MKTSLWIVIVVVVFFVGLLVGYSLSPTSHPVPVTSPTAADKAQ